MSQAAHFDPTTGRALRVNEPLRPDLKPGEKVTWTPDRFCEACSQARGTRVCPICGGVTVMRESLSAVDQVPVSFEPGAPPPHDPGAGELEPPRAAGPDDDDDAGGELEHDDDDDDDDDAGGELEHDAGGELADDERAELDAPPRAADLEEHPTVRGARTPTGPRGELVRARQTEAVDVPTRRKRIVDVEPAPQRRENPYPVRDKRRTVPTFNPPDRGAAAMSTNQNAARRIPQRAVELDEGGREIHRSGNARRARSLEDVYDTLWDEGKVEVTTWNRYAAAAASTGLQPSEAASYADQLYMELILRQQKK